LLTVLYSLDYFVLFHWTFLGDSDDEYLGPIEAATLQGSNVAVGAAHIDDDLIEEEKDLELKSMMDKRPSLCNKRFPGFFSCPYCIGRARMDWSIKTLLEHTHAYGCPGKRSVEMAGKHQALEAYIVQDARFALALDV